MARSVMAAGRYRPEVRGAERVGGDGGRVPRDTDRTSITLPRFAGSGGMLRARDFPPPERTARPVRLAPSLPPSP
jgi:hypothetical protein